MKHFFSLYLAVFLVLTSARLIADTDQLLNSPSSIEASKEFHESKMQEKDHEHQVYLKELEYKRQQQLKELELRMQLKSEEEHTKQMLYLGGGIAIAGVSIGIGLFVRRSK